VLSSHGIPSLLVRYRHRYGIALGVFFSLALIFLSGSVVWDIRIDGEDRLSENEVLSALEECGLSLGTPRRSIDIDALENRVLILSDEISWISVNIIGTVAEVEIREVQFPDEQYGSEFSASNIVASKDGKIVGFENIKGNIAVEIGETVRKGQLLIGGIYGDEENGFRYTASEGRVLAEVERELLIEIPRSEEQKIYTGEQKCEKSLIFFKKRIKFFSNYRNLPTSCDKIDIEEFFPAPNGKEIPIGIYTSRYAEYRYESVERTDDELLSLGYSRLDTLLRTELAKTELLSKEIETEIREDSLILRCKVRCIEDIASEQEIKIDGLP
jgi:similar to stage IV sporulation protein